MPDTVCGDVVTNPESVMVTVGALVVGCEVVGMHVVGMTVGYGVGATVGATDGSYIALTTVIPTTLYEKPFTADHAVNTNGHEPEADTSP